MIRFNKPVHLGTEVDAIAKAIIDHGLTSAGGPFGARCEQLLSALTNTNVLLTTSCTHALEMAAQLLELKPGDAVLVPSFTFPSSANAFIRRNAVPVFVDCDASGNLDLRDLERKLGPRVKAIVVVHYGGASCDMTKLLAVAGETPVMEDAAQAICAPFQGQALGTFGALGAFSFHETKNIGCGEGGALLVNESRFAERARHLRDKGTNRQQFLDGLVEQYEWVDAGSSFALADLNAAYLWAQLEALEQIQNKRHAVVAKYASALSQRFASCDIDVLAGSANAHVFALVMRDRLQRARFIEFMREREVVCAPHYVALHRSLMGARFHDGTPLPMTDRLCDCLVRLPLYYNLTDAEVAQVIEATLQFIEAEAK